MIGVLQLRALNYVVDSHESLFIKYMTIFFEADRNVGEFKVW